MVLRGPCVLRFFHGATPELVSAFNLAHPVPDVAVVTLVLTVVARVGPGSRPVGMLIAAAIVGVGVADSELTHQVGLGISVPGSVFANGWIAGLLCLGVAAIWVICFRRQPEVV